MSESRNSGGKGCLMADAGEPAEVGGVRLSDNDHAFARRLYRAALAPERAALLDEIDWLAAAGVSRIHIADVLVPAVARLLGEDWCRDQISFATTTIGTSRLQAALRHLGPCWTGDHAIDPDAPNILLVVTQNDQHTLGAILLSGQLRRRGCSVLLLLDADVAQLRTSLERSHFDGMFVTVPSADRLENVREIVKAFRQLSPSPLPVVVGGLLCETEANVHEATGADYATNDADEALALCRLTASSLARTGS